MKESRYNIWTDYGGAKYLYNGVSGALLRVPTTEYDAVQRFLSATDPSPECSTGLLKNMAVGRMLIPDDADELDLLEKRYRVSRNDLTHFALTIVTSLGCNFDCPYCFEDKHPSIMDDEVQRLVIEALDDQLPKIAGFKVSWYGGEPLVGKRALLALSDAFIERCDGAGVNYGADIITNGYLLTKQTCEQLRDRRIAGAQITLDGPPEIHNRMRPRVGGGGSFWEIVENLHYAAECFEVTVRVNLSTENYEHAETLFQILVDEGLADKVAVYPGQIISVDDGAPAPSRTYQPRCFPRPEFARVERAFLATAARYSLTSSMLPKPKGTPCTAVRANELIVGSKGELYKCWESVGNALEVVGHIREYQQQNGRLQKWLKYDPFADQECRSCVALPGCMGGCAHHSLVDGLHDNRCDTFRYTYREQVDDYVRKAEDRGLESEGRNVDIANAVLSP
jgi:uncharacterized protein